jgi:hypothetical protein
MSYVATSVTSTGQYAVSFYGNSIVYCGPQYNYTGGFNNQAPTGAAYYFGTNAANSGTGSPAQYGQYFVRSSKIMVSAIAAAAGTIGGTCTVIPCTNSSLVGFTASNILEQPFAVTFDLGAYAAAGNNAAPVINNSMTTRTLLGYKHDSSLEANPQLNGVMSVGSGVPALPWYWHVVFSSANASTSIVQYWNVTVDYEVEFRSRNIPTSAPPS